MKFIIFQLICFGLIFGYSAARHSQKSVPIEPEGKCGYEKCTKAVPGKLNIHIVAHTHDDVGWLKTVDQYYYGDATKIQIAGIQYILDSVIQELIRDPEKQFIYVESAYFTKWWVRQTPALQRKVKELVAEGRLEFVGGAWSMNDEAAVHYNSVIDQFAWGLKFLNETFGECGRPKVGWQIDPFGHSREMTSIFAQMGYDGNFFARLDWRDKSKRLREQTPEMIWHGSDNLDPKVSDLFTGVLHSHYMPPPGWCFDIICNDDPVIDDPDSEDYNVIEKVGGFVEHATNYSEYYRTNHIMYTMGGDFNFMAAHMYFQNLDLLIKYANELYGDKVHMYYSTPTCYLKSLHDAGITWPEKSDDFLPLGNDPHTYWTGYYTSRPTQKRYERMGNNFLQVCKQLTALAPTQKPFYQKNLDGLRNMMGVWQHHDAITGTEKQHVADDYALLMHNAMKGCEANAQDILKDLLGNDVDHSICLFLNETQCEPTEDSKPVKVITLYNPTGHSRKQKVRVPLPDETYTLVDENQKEMEFQTMPIPSTVLEIQGRVSTAKYELVFESEEIPPLLTKTYYVKFDEDKETKNNWIDFDLGNFAIENEHLKLNFRDKFLNQVTSGDFVENIQQHFVVYKGYRGNNWIFANRSSGAYIFRPDPEWIRVLSPIKTEVFRGDIVQEVHQIYNDWISQVIRLYKGDRHVEFHWLVGEIPVDDEIGKEVVSRFLTNIESDKVFYTDSNGREMLKRVRDYRPTFDFDNEEFESGNYYPVTTKIVVEDEKSRMAVLTDRAQGGSSLQDGFIELMVHRRTLNDDAFGVEEPLNESVTARGTHYLFFGPQSTEHPTQAARERILQSDILVHPWTFFASSNEIPSKTKVGEQKSYGTLPLNVRLLTFEPWGTEKDPRVLVRFEQFLEKDEDPELSKPVTVNLEEFFNQKMEEFRETTLDGNQWLDETERLKWNPDSEVSNVNFDKTVPLKRDLEGVEIELKPMEIRTFIVKI